MKIHNVHQRHLPATPEEVDDLLASLGSDDDALWPRDAWFPMRLDRLLAVGARGGHGPVRYNCTHRAPRTVTFTFDSILGSPRWHGEHRFTVEPDGDGSLLTHHLHLNLRLREYLQWVLLVEPLHDAILEDLLHDAAGDGNARRNMWARLLRWALPGLRGRRTNPLTPPQKATEGSQHNDEKGYSKGPSAE